MLKIALSLNRLAQLAGRLFRTIRKSLPWLAGPLLGLAAYCPLYYFALAGSWLPHLVVLCLLWTIWLLFRQNNQAAGWLCAWSILATTSLLLNAEKPEESVLQHGNTLTVAQVNVLQFNQRHERVALQVEALGADVIAFQEVDQAWADSLVKVLAHTYPFFSLAPQDNCYGMALFSKVPLEDIQLRFWEGYPAISARISSQGQDTLILSLHAASPVTPQRYQARNKQLMAAASFMKNSKLPTLLIGDLNTVPWDPALKPLFESASLQDSRAKHYTATWPSYLGRWGIPIDYVLHSEHWQRLSHQSVRILGSDHRAMVATLAMKPTANTDPHSIQLTQQ